ncbi:MAG: efflux RND transporter periplasmic adaptor subunit [Planctomycetaceae bacterium]|nr:efflux RND transporter periplasmic adaptor subunit [Planctomycetaceae bacterium]
MLIRFVLAVCFLVGSLSSQGKSQSEADAFTAPYQELELAVGDAGVLTEVNVRTGEAVEVGQILAKLDTRVLDASLQISQAKAKFFGAVNAATAERDLRGKQFRQIENLYGRGHATERELERAETDYRISNARVEMAREELLLHRLECKRIEAQIERRRIRSPIDGVVSDVNKEVGESFSLTDPHLMTIVQLNKLRAKFSLTPAESAGIQIGDQVSLRVTSPAREVIARVESVHPVIDAKSGTLIISMVIDNSKRKLRSGCRCFMRTPREGSKTSYTAK